MPAFDTGVFAAGVRGTAGRSRKMTKKEKQLAERKRIDAALGGAQRRRPRKPKKPDTRSQIQRLSDALERKL